MSGAWKKNKPRTTSLLDGREDEFCRMHNTMKDKDLAVHFDVAVISIERWRKKLNLTKERFCDGSTHFKESKDDFIEIHDEHSDQDLADIFEISVSGVEKWRAKLKLKKDPNKKWELSEHPKGYKGKKHSPETREKLGVKAKKYWADLTEEEKKLGCIKRVPNKIKKWHSSPKKQT